MPDETNKIYAPLSQVMDSETESNNVTINDGSIGSLSTLEADDQHLMLASGKHLSRRGGMSASRKLCFISSIVILLGIVMIFFFVMPCPEDSLCPSRAYYRKNWVKDYENLELVGPVNILRDPQKTQTSLAFMYRNDLFASSRKKTKKPFGIMAILSHTGQISWHSEVSVEPIYMNCSTVDLNRDGEPDCLVVDVQGQLSAYTPGSGALIWKLKELRNWTGSEPSDYFTFPLVLPDLNGDGVNELLHIVRTQASRSQNSWSLISGKNGRAIGEPISNGECSLISNLEFVELYSIRYSCHADGGQASSKLIGLNDLYAALTKKTIDVAHLNASTSLVQASLRPQNLTKVTLTLKNFTLMVENSGSCPNSCSALISLWHNRTSEDSRLVYNISEASMFAPVPISFTFPRSKYGKHGFVFKYFQWKTDQLNASNADGHKIRILMETVALVVFSSGKDVKIENTSQRHIMQFCRVKGGVESCQPKIPRDSMVIADIDKDGSQELITFFATFDSRTRDRRPGKEHLLKSYVQMLDLETEIPKLFEAARRK